MSAKKETEIEVSKKNEVALPMEDFDLFMSDGKQDEKISAEDCTIPRLNLLQSNSPWCQRGKPQYNPEAKAGDFVDTITDEIFSGDEGIRVIPCAQRTTYLEWWPKESKDGQGFIADHGNTPEILRSTTKGGTTGNKDVTERGTHIEKTMEFYVLLVKEDGSFSPYVISFKSTGLKVAKDWGSLINGARRKHPSTGQLFSPAKYFCSYTLSSRPQEKNGDTWMNWTVQSSDDVPSLTGGVALYTEAKNFADVINSGAKKADRSESSDNEGF